MLYNLFTNKDYNIYSRTRLRRTPSGNNNQYVLTEVLSQYASYSTSTKMKIRFGEKYVLTKCTY